MKAQAEAATRHRQAMAESGSRLGWLYDQVTGDEDARVCKDIPDAACRHQPRNFFAYLVANLLGKIGDELASARLILPWLLGALGAPAAFAGFLVPVREAGVLLPQLLVAAYVRNKPHRKGVWLLGAVLTAFALFLLAGVAWGLDGATAGWAVLGLVALFSLARGLCSVSAKDVLGKTVSKTRRGVLMGYSAGLAGFATLLVGGYIQARGAQFDDVGFIAGLLVVAGALWLLAAAVFAAIQEAPGATEGGGNALAAAFASLGILRTDAEFRRYVVNRALLLSVALAPPFYVLLAQQRTGSDLASLGLLVIASSLAASLSSPLLGRLGDRSSRMVIALGAGLAAVTGGATWALVEADAALMAHTWSFAALYVLISLAHSAVRLGRKIYLVDLGNGGSRSAYVAVSNTVIGVLMLAGGLVGVVADRFGVPVALLLLAAVSLMAAVHALRLPEVSG
ncbi:MAG: MFS transporter [Thiobacillus sp.]|nr:MFS transporter [Thiobacillus sp.]